MTGNKVLAFFSVLTVPSLVSGHHLAVQHDKRFDLGLEPVSLCYTYFSYYLAPLETPPYGYPGGSPVVTTITSIVQQTSLVPIFPTPILPTLPSGLPSLSPAPPPSASTPGPVPSPLPGPVEIILAIIPPTVSGRKLAKKDLGGFISDDVGSPNPKDCKSATTYTLDSGSLQVSSSLSFSIFADAGTTFTEFRSRSSLNAGANIVATTFLNDNSVLRWQNASFSGGFAGFCQVAATGQVYTTYVDSPTLWPAGCLPVTISVLDPSQCVAQSTTAGPLPSTTSIATPIGSTQSVGPSSDLISTTSAEPSSGGFSQSITDLPSTSLVEPPSSSSLSQATAPFSNTTGIPSSALPESSSVPESSTFDSSNPDTSSNPSTEGPSSGAPTSSYLDSSTTATEPQSSLSTSESSDETSLTSQGTSDFPTSTTDSTQTSPTSDFTASTTFTDSSASSPSSDSTQFSSYSDSTLSTFSTGSTSTFFFSNSSTVAP